MGTWGVKLYDDDTAQDVKDEYVDLLRQGIENEEATKRMIERWDTDDVEEGPIFWITLANTQWEYGKLIDIVKEKAIYYIESEVELERWKEDKELYDKRKEILNEVAKKLKTQNENPKKIRKYRIYKCPWNIGDVYAYKIKDNEEYKGKYIALIKIEEGDYWPHNICPVVYVYNKMFDEIPTIEAVKDIKYLPQFYKPSVYRGEYKDVLYRCLIGIENSTKKKIEEYIYIGNIEKYSFPKNEYKRGEEYLCSINRFEEYIISVYNKWKGIDYSN